MTINLEVHWGCRVFYPHPGERIVEKDGSLFSFFCTQAHQHGKRNAFQQKHIKWGFKTYEISYWGRNMSKRGEQKGPKVNWPTFPRWRCCLRWGFGALKSYFWIPLFHWLWNCLKHGFRTRNVHFDHQTWTFFTLPHFARWFSHSNSRDFPVWFGISCCQTRCDRIARGFPSPQSTPQAWTLRSFTRINNKAFVTCK